MSISIQLSKSKILELPKQKSFDKYQCQSECAKLVSSGKSPEAVSGGNQ